MFHAIILFFVILVVSVAPVCAQLPPEIGYMVRSGGQAGTTVDVILGGYDWTPDMQVFVHDPRIKLEIVGPPSQVLITEPPYWFGYKARGYAWPLPREFPARLTIPADVSAGLISWQVANANGISPVGTFQVGLVPEVAEDLNRKSVQVLPRLPVTVSGQIRRIEEIDRYRFSVPKSGPVTIELIARRVGSPLHGMIKVRDPDGRALLDVADTEGRDLTVTMSAIAGVEYELSLHDLDFAGDRSYVYRLMLTAAPQVLAAYPAAGRRGETHSIDFVGLGLVTGGNQLEAVTRDVTFPASPGIASIEYAVQSDFGTAKPFQLLVTDLNEIVDSASAELIPAVPVAITGSIEKRFGSDEYLVPLTKGQILEVTAQAKAIGSPLDVDVTVFGPDSKQLATNDDVPGTTDATLALNVPADGNYRFVVTDRSGKSGSRAANYRLIIQHAKEDVEITAPAQISIPIGGQGKLTLKCVRKGGFKGAVPVSLTGLPEGLKVPENLTIAENMAELAIDVSCSPDAPATASLCSIAMAPQLGGPSSTRKVGSVLIATTLKPRFKLTPEGLDDVRKVHRGSTYLFPMLIDRLEGFDGPITLEMTSKQQRHRQGLASDEFVVPSNAKRVEYPIFVPEWLETTKTSRMILNGSAQVADPKGNVRTVLQRQELRFGILPEGALMKLSHRAGELVASPGDELQIPLTLSIAAELKEPIELSFVENASQKQTFSCTPVTLQAGQRDATLLVHISADSAFGEHELHFRASSKKEGWPVISETKLHLDIRPGK